MPETRHPCPCCGYRTCEQAAGGTMQICPVCGWEDSPWDYGSNDVALPIAQRNFEATGACEESFLTLVRQPLAAESRQPGWISFTGSAHAIIEFIEKSFRDVSLDHGTRLNQSFDDHSSDSYISKLSALNSHRRWQNIPHQDLAVHDMSLISFDAKGIHFHLPAFMRHSLHCWEESPWADFGDTDMLIYSLQEGPRSLGYHKDDFRYLEQAQLQSVAAYLKFVEANPSSYRKDARKGLDNGWHDWLPDFIPFPSLQS